MSRLTYVIAISLTAVGTVGTVAAAVSWMLSSAVVPGVPVTFVAVSAAAASAGAAILVVLYGMWMGRGTRQLARRIHEEGQAERPGTLRGPAHLDALAGAMTEVLAWRHEREQKLLTEARDLRIRHRVSEADRQMTSAVLDSLRDVVLVTNAFDEIMMANQAAARAFGFELEKALHRPIQESIKDEVLCRMIADVREASGSGSIRHVEHTMTCADGVGTPSSFDVVMSSVPSAQGEKAGVVAILHDLTREHAVSQMKTDFVAKASHELRTPLTSIRAYVEMLIDGEATDEESRAEFYQIIRNETDRLGRLIDNMLNISRIEAGIIQIERTSVDMRDLVLRAADTMQPQAQQKRIVITPKLADVDLQVEGDSDMLYQVVLNLVSNAVKYTPDGGRVTISADSDNLTRSIVVSVADTGLGIPPDSLGRVFEKFFRIENYSRIAKGTGLGLNLCRHIVETVHRGTIDVESTLGMGSRFTFTIPMRYAGLRPAA